MSIALSRTDGLDLGRGRRRHGERVSTSGGSLGTLATGLQNAGMLLVMGSNVVWVNPATKALSDPTVPSVMTACMELE